MEVSGLLRISEKHRFYQVFYQQYSTGHSFILSALYLIGSETSNL